MYLPTKEIQKLRRMRRAADLKEEQAKVRLGLAPSARPKIKLGNMMRVMGEQAIADPTAVEMLVESQIQQRHDEHVTQNEERKLTKEQQHAKLVIVEGGLHSIAKFKKLMLHRIKWDQNAPTTETQLEKQASEPQWLRSMDDAGNLKDYSTNRCILVFEGEFKSHAFRKWGSKMCETAGEARELLARSKLDSLWALAKSME